MSGLDIRIELEETVTRRLDKAASLGSDLTQPMAEIAEVLVEGAQQRFETRIGPDGVPWKRSRRAIESNDEPPTLTLTGQLKRQIVPEYGRDFAMAGVVKTAGPGKYARIHQLGGTIVPRVKKALAFGGRLLSKVVMPARPYLGFGAHEREHVPAILQRHLKAIFGESA